MKLFSKEAAGLAITGAWLYAANQMVPWAIQSALTYTGWAVSWALEMTGNGLESLTQPIIGSAAPTLAPMIVPTVAGVYLGKKLWEYLFDENSPWKRRVATITWAALGWAAWLSASVATPYIVWAAALYAGRKIPLWAAGKIWQSVWAVWGWATSFVWGGVKWAVKWGANGISEWWKSPSIKPKTGF